uniref:Uncharacterized protein n=1 Tax=Arundo donax TaxID=35708 RepID=A0A0A9FEG4_ARUDO
MVHQDIDTPWSHYLCVLRFQSWCPSVGHWSSSGVKSGWCGLLSLASMEEGDDDAGERKDGQIVRCGQRREPEQCTPSLRRPAVGYGG